MIFIDALGVLMFDFLPKEINLRIFSFFNKQTLASVSQVSKLGKQLAENEQLLLKSLDLDKHHLPEQFSAREIYQIYNDLFKLRGNNFCSLLKNNKYSFTELQQLLQQGLSLAYIYTNVDVWPTRILCPQSYPFNNQSSSIPRNLLRAKSYLKKWTSPPDIEDLKQKYSLLDFYSFEALSFYKRDFNCFIVFSQDKDLSDFEEICKKIKETSIQNNKPMPFIIPIFTPCTLIYEIPKPDPGLPELIQEIRKLPQEKINKLGGLDKIIEILSVDDEICIKKGDAFTSKIHSLSLPIAATVCEPKGEDSMLWTKLPEIINTIQKAAWQLKAIETVEQQNIAYKI